MSVLVCDNVSKKSLRKESIKNFSFDFLDNKVYAIVGRSDSGKDTLLDTISGKVKASDGSVYLDGEKLHHNKVMNERICYIPKDTTFPGFLKVEQIFKMMNRKYVKWDNYLAHKIIDVLQISKNTPYYKIPKSKRSIFLGAIAISSRCNITIFDDPVFCSDAKERYDFFNILYSHHQMYPRTIIIATDYVDDIDYLIDNILFFEKGKLIAQFNINDIKNDFRYLSGKTEVLKSLISGVKVIGYEEREKELTVCIRKKLSKDDIRKYQKYMIKISEVPIQKVFVYLINLRQKKGID